METKDVVKKEVLKVVKMTDKAWLLKIKNVRGEDSKELWLPKSMCKLITENKKKIVVVPQWLWTKKEQESNLPF